MSRVADNTAILREVRALSREVREVRKILEMEDDPYDRLEYYEHPERIIASFEKAKKRYGKPRK